MSKSNFPKRPAVPDPEGNDRAHRRTFTAAYNLQVVQVADACTDPGQIGALLRREGLYHTHLATWRKQRLKGEQQALAPRKRGRKPAEKNPLADEVARLEREKTKLEEKLRRAHLTIDFQKKTFGNIGNTNGRKPRGRLLTAAAQLGEELGIKPACDALDAVPPQTDACGEQHSAA